MTAQKSTTHTLVERQLVIFQRPRSKVWQCRFSVDGRWQRASTNEYDLKLAKARAHEILVEANVRKKMNAAPITRFFKDVAKLAVQRMEKAIEEKTAKVMYTEYIAIINKYLIKFFGKYKVDNITFQLLEQFDTWRVEKMKITPKRSTTLNHNAALNRVFDEAIIRGFMVESNRPKLVAYGQKSVRRPAFSMEEVRALRANFDAWIGRARADSIEIRALLKDYVMVLLDTGARPGTELMELKWSQIEIKYYPITTKKEIEIKDTEHPDYEDDFEINHNITAIVKLQKGKTGARNLIGRNPTIKAFREIARRNYGKTLTEVIKENIKDKVFTYWELITDRQGNSNREPKLKTPTSFNKLFESYLNEHNLLVDPVTNQNRVLYSLRHTYATIALQIDKVEIHTLAVQMGTSVGMIEQHYSHLDAVKAVHQLRGDQSRQLIEATGAIDDRYTWDVSKAKPIRKLRQQK